MLRPWRVQAPPHEICMPVLYLSLQQAIGSRCMGDWLGYKGPAQMDWSLDFGYRWIWIVNWIWDCRCRWFWIIVVVCLYYHLPDFTLHLLFLFTTLIFTTRLL